MTRAPTCTLTLTIPEGVTDDEEGDIRGVSATEDVLGRRLHHLPVRHDDLLAIESLLHPT